MDTWIGKKETVVASDLSHLQFWRYLIMADMRLCLLNIELEAIIIKI
jgi:hypothetical protein